MYKRMIVASVCVAVVALFVAAQQGVTQNADKQLTIGIVNTSDVRQNCIEIQDIISNLEQLRDDTQQKVETLEQEIKQLQGSLAFLKKGSDNYNKTQDTLLEKRAMANYLTQYMQDNLTRKSNEAYVSFYKKMNDTIVAYGKERGYDLILKTGDIVYEGSTEEEVFLQIAQHKVLYYSNEIDITNDIITIMNDTYNKDGKE